MATVTVRTLEAKGHMYHAVVDVPAGVSELATGTRLQTFPVVAIANYAKLYGLGTEEALQKVLAQPYPEGTTVNTGLIAEAMKEVEDVVGSVQQVLVRTPGRSGSGNPVADGSVPGQSDLAPGVVDRSRPVPPGHRRRIVAGE
jgi:hypothetical protein